MFGMGFVEILIIAVIAILFLGPDKLPSAMVDIAKFFRQMKSTIGNVKDTLEQEMNVSEIKAEALAYKKELLDAQDKLSEVTDISGIGTSISDLSDDFLDDDDDDKPVKKEVKTKPAPKEEKVTFEKKPKKEENVDV